MTTAAAPTSFDLFEFLRRELAPYPGRWIATGRITVACTAALILCMTWRVPEAHLAVWVVFKVALEETGETLLTGIAGLAALTLAIGASLVLLFVAMDQPALRFCLIGANAALALFLRRTFAIGTLGFVLGLVPTVLLTSPDFIPSPESIVHGALWLWSVFAIGIACAVAANLLIAPNDPAVLLRRELGDRLRAAAAALERRLGGRSDAPDFAALAAAGVTRLLALLRSAALLHPEIRARRAQQAALITAVDRLVGAAAALASIPVEPLGAERERLEAVAAACTRIAETIGRDERPSETLRVAAAPAPAEGGGSALRPILVELETAVALARQALASDAAVAAAAGPSLFAADVFSNPEYVRYALKGALSVLIVYLLQSAVDWPGIRTCIITIMIVGLTSEGATIQKATLRFGGALVGGALGFLAILLAVPAMESIASQALLVASGSALAAWVYVGSARISYAGVQIAFAFFVCVIQDFGPSWYFYTIRDRMIGILLGNAVITVVFLQVWPVRAGESMWASLAAALRGMAQLARVGSWSEEQAAVAGAIQSLRALVQRCFAEAQQSAEEDALEWRDRGRSRLQDAAAQAQAVFLTQLALASQRPDLGPLELPAALLEGDRRFESAIAASLEALADRAPLPDLRAPFDEVSGVIQTALGRIEDAEVATQVAGRLELYRELVPRVERLAWAELGP